MPVKCLPLGGGQAGRFAKDLENPGVKLGGGLTRGDRDWTQPPPPSSQRWPRLATSHGCGGHGGEPLWGSGIPWVPWLMHEPLAASLVHVLSLPRSPRVCSVCLITLSLVACPVLGLAAAVSVDWRLSLETPHARRGMPRETLGNGWDIVVQEGRSFAQRCPFIQRTFLRLTPGAGSGPRRGASQVR